LRDEGGEFGVAGIRGVEDRGDELWGEGVRAGGRGAGGLGGGLGLVGELEHGCSGVSWRC